ncbi:hypothetical protein BCR44DRAFT_1513100 [Catenaria anguillulae PL171]|uniref:Sm domain-containing protein n=1 Tax=Catenaria anguillulae PL171 TaxID=765915 RepID=A0A1Y2HM04_9FUNG|nr:hypothetical protein BCR44DRAFT_1513100 [Catenaria anguillulae PL171]
MDQTTEYLNESVIVLTRDGDLIRGIFLGIDQHGNLILNKPRYRRCSAEKGIYDEQPVNTAMIVRGDNLVMMGRLDEEAEAKLPLSEMKAEPIGRFHPV